MNFSNFAKDKGIGYWFSWAITLLFLITGIIYLVGVSGNATLQEYNVLNIVAVVALFVGAGASIVILLLQAFKVIPAKLNIVPYVQALCALLALLFFVYGAYYYVSVVMVAIDLDHYEGIFLVFACLFVLLFGLGVANVFLKQTKELEEASNE